MNTQLEECNFRSLSLSRPADLIQTQNCYKQKRECRSFIHCSTHFPYIITPNFKFIAFLLPDFDYLTDLFIDI